MHDLKGRLLTRSSLVDGYDVKAAWTLAQFGTRSDIKDAHQLRQLGTGCAEHGPGLSLSNFSGFAPY